MCIAVVLVTAAIVADVVMVDVVDAVDVLVDVDVEVDVDVVVNAVSAPVILLVLDVFAATVFAAVVAIFFFSSMLQILSLLSF